MLIKSQNAGNVNDDPDKTLCLQVKKFSVNKEKVGKKHFKAYISLIRKNLATKAD